MCVGEINALYTDVIDGCKQVWKNTRPSQPLSGASVFSVCQFFLLFVDIEGVEVGYTTQNTMLPRISLLKNNILKLFLKFIFKFKNFWRQFWNSIKNSLFFFYNKTINRDHKIFLFVVYTTWQNSCLWKVFFPWMWFLKRTGPSHL